MSNPYLARGPVRDPAMLFGRGHELREIAAFIRGTQSVALIGPRKIGKTSLLYQLMRPATWPGLGLGDENLFVYMDCEVLGTGAHAELFGQFAAEVQAVCEERGLPPEPALAAAVDRPGRMSFEAAIRKLNQRGLRVVLILDEFERMSTNPQLDVNFFNALRSIAGRYQLAFLTASARPLIELTYAGRSQEILSSPFFNIFAPIFLGMLDEADSRLLIGEPARREGLSLAASADAIYDLVGGHPFALQVACFHAIEAGGDMVEAEARALRELSSHFQYTWSNLAPAEQHALQQLRALTAYESSDTTLRVLLRDLAQKCVLVGAEGAYRYPSRAWAQFVAGQSLDENSAPTLAVVGPRRAGAAAQPAAALPAPVAMARQIGPYEIYEQLGRGGMADVYRGRHTRLDREVAIKMLPASMAAHGDFRARFEREARAVAGLRHPNIVQVYDFGDSDGMYYMVMEYIAGANLAQLIASRGALPLDEARALIGDVAAALEHAHAQGVIHRDVKPANVMIRSAEAGAPARAILTDFGIARLLAGGAASQTTTMVGTLDYMAPEQIQEAGGVDTRTDIYALGVLSFQLLTGRLPFVGEHAGEVMRAHLQEPPPDPRRWASDLSAAAAAAILRAMSKRPDDRQPSAGELARELAG